MKHRKYQWLYVNIYLKVVQKCSILNTRPFGQLLPIVQIFLIYVSHKQHYIKPYILKALKSNYHFTFAPKMSSQQEQGQVSKSDSQFSVDLKTNKIKKKTKRKKSKKPTTPKIITSTYKKQKCLHFNKGNCTKGELCTFSHDFQPQSHKIICRFFLSNACSKGAACNFSHNTQDYPCKFHHLQNRCYLHNECRFSHKPINKEYISEFIKENKDHILSLWRDQKLHLITDQNLKRQIILFIPKQVGHDEPKKKGFKGELKLLAQNNIELAQEIIKPKQVAVDPRLKIRIPRPAKVEQNLYNQNSAFYRDWVTQLPDHREEEMKVHERIFDRRLIQQFLYSNY